MTAEVFWLARISQATDFNLKENLTAFFRTGLSGLN
jgi:hypothetical protein